MRLLCDLCCLLAVVALLTGLAPLAAEPLELIRDPHFRRGFNVSAPTPGKHVLAGVLRTAPQGPDPVWRLCQWSSRYPLLDFAPQAGADGSLCLANEGKLVRIGRPGTEQGDLTLAVEASREYGGRARAKDEPWVHLLVSQEFSREVWLPQLTALRLHLEVRVPRCDRNPAAEYSPRIHAAQVPLFITVQNRNRASAGYGDYYHFGVPLFDNREPSPHAFIAGDQGTGKLMYVTPAAAWAARGTHGGQWVTFEGDLLPEMRRGLQAAWERGFLEDSHDPGDYRPAGLCVGWEVPGVFDVTAQLRNLSLRAEPEPGPR